MPKEILGKTVLPAPYNQGTKVGNTIHIAGQIGIDGKGKLAEGGIKAETRQVMENIKAVVEAGGGTMNDIMSTTVFVTNWERDYADYNEVYAEYFTEGQEPARASMHIKGLALGALIEIMAVAMLSD